MRYLIASLLLIIVTDAHAKDYSRLFERLSPAVVTLQTLQSAISREGKGITKTTSQGLGSGVIIDSDGTILTASHVVNAANRLKVELKDGRTFDASVISAVQVADLAVIRIDNPPDDLVVVAPGDSDKIKIGEDVFVIGAPYGLKHTFTAGNLSARRVMEQVYFGDDLELLQTDAPINQGNSGGPLFSSKGELIGIVSHIKSKSGGSVGLGFAASINMAKELILEQPPLWFGMEYITLNNQSLRVLNVKGYDLGLLVQSVADGSLGARFGVKSGSFPIQVEDQKLLLGGDIIVAVGNTRLSPDLQKLGKIRDYLNDAEVGELMQITVIREGETVLLTTRKPAV